MMSALTRKHDEVKRLLETYYLYKDCNDESMRRKAHLDLDRFLMENRATAIICMEQVLAEEIQGLAAKQKSQTKASKSWFSKLKLWRSNPAPTKPTKEISQ